MREELSGATAVPLAGSRAMQRWVSFSFGHGGEAGEASEEHERYWLQKVTAVKGRPPDGLQLGCKVIRRESEGTRPPFASGVHLEGNLEARLSSRTSDETALQASWQRQPWRVSLLLTFAHSPAFWALPKEERAATYLRLPDVTAGNHAANDTVLGRVIHRLYRTRSRQGQDAATWDYLAYFE